MNKEIYTFLSDANKTAINSLKHFFKLLNLNPDAFEHLYNIPTKISKTDEDAFAEYIPNEHIILVNPNYIKDMYELYEEAKDDEKLKNKILANTALTLIHETLHANRTVMIEEGLNASNILNKTDTEIFRYAHIKSGNDLNQYDSLLEKIIDKPFVKDLKTFIPIKITFNKDNSYTVVAYNKEEKYYYIFENQFYQTKPNDNADEFLHQIGLELNEGNHKGKELTTGENLPKKEKITVASDYIKPFIDKGVSASEQGLSLEEYAKQVDNNLLKATFRMENAEGMEEILTETLALMIIIHRKEEKLDIDNAAQKILNDSSITIDNVIGTKLITAMGTDMIKWFLTSVYEDQYEDKLEKTFQEEYDNLLLDYQDIYDAIKYDDEVYQFSVDDALRIIEEKTGKKRR